MSDLVGNTENWFSRVAAPILIVEFVLEVESWIVRSAMADVKNLS